MSSTDRRAMLLADFAPQPMLRVSGHPVDKPAFPVIDAHNHLGNVFGGDWARRDPAELTEVLNEVGVEKLVDLDGGQGQALSHAIERWQATDRVLVLAGLDYEMWETDRAFGEEEARRLHDSVNRGAKGLKIWKLLGLRARDPRGQIVAVDDQRLDPLFGAAAELRVPIVIHVGDPRAFFEPLDHRNERWEELAAHPEWHFWPPRSKVRPDGWTPVDELLAAFDRLVGRHPDVTFIGAHVASSAEDLAYVSWLLGRHPNLYVDIAERIGELGRQPYTARDFMIKHADRILFGLDRPADARLYRLYYRFLETLDESFDYGVEEVPRQGRWQIHGLGLPEVVLRRIYRENARRALRLDSPQ